MTQEAQLILVSNRGPATFERDERGELTVTRGGGGLVTALTGLVNHRDALWVASAMTRRGRGGQPAARRRLVRLRRRRGDLQGPACRERRGGLRPVLQRRGEPAALVHPALPLGPLERAGHPPQRDRRLRARLPRRERGPRPRGAGGGRRPGRRGDAARLPPVHRAARDPARATRTRSSTTSSTSRGPSRTPGACCRATCARRSTRACSRTTSSASTRGPTSATSCSAAASCSTWTWTRRPASSASRAARCGCAPTRCRSRPRASSARRAAPRWRSTSRSCSAAAAST